VREPNPFQQDGTWWNDRLGKLTGSRMAAAMNYLKSGKESSERENLRYEVVAERITNTFADKYMTSDMQWGVEQEAAAKEAFETRTGLMVKDVGFIDHPSIDHCGVSPDGFVSDGCLIEVKCPKTKTHMKYVANQVIPAEYKPQMLLQSACTGKDVWFVSYDPRMGEGKDLFIKKYVPTPEELAEVEAAAEKFLAECDALFEFFNDESNYFDKGSF
jgi:predicted phage-related endonuclease